MWDPQNLTSRHVFMACYKGRLFSRELSESKLICTNPYRLQGTILKTTPERPRLKYGSPILHIQGHLQNDIQTISTDLSFEKRKDNYYRYIHFTKKNIFNVLRRV
jgi:hypothetical protein